MSKQKHKLDSILEEVRTEFIRARKQHPLPFHSFHEGHSVLEEEFDEFWDEVKKRPSKRDLSAMREETVQVAAMAVRFIYELLEDQ